MGLTRMMKTMMAIGLLVMSLPVLGQERVPLIDRELFFGDPEIGGAQISPDGKFIAFVKPFQGTSGSRGWRSRSVQPD